MDGTGLDGVYSIYQGHLFFQKATYALRWSRLVVWWSGLVVWWLSGVFQFSYPSIGGLNSGLDLDLKPASF